MTDLELFAACNKLLQGKYGKELKIYSKEVVDGYDVPCFFTEIDDNGYTIEGYNLASYEPSYTIIYFQKIADDIDQLKKLAEIRALFGKAVKVGDRYAKVSEIEMGHSGERKTVTQYTINFDTVYCDISEPDVLPTADTLDVAEIIK